jgi:ABC-2 type transport system ATP-binding protein
MSGPLRRPKRCALCNLWYTRVKSSRVAAAVAFSSTICQGPSFSYKLLKKYVPAAGRDVYGKHACDVPFGKRDVLADAHACGRRLNDQTQSSNPMIQVRDLTKHYHDLSTGTHVALDGINFHAYEGEIFGLLGPNGAGKSTTFRMLCGLLPVTAGVVQVAGLDLRHAAAQARARLGYMAQRFSLYSDLTVLQNLRFFASAYGLDRVRRRQRIDWALQAFELEGHAGDNCRDLPLGFKQRLAMAAALMHEPDILFLDEPTSGVDPLARREFWQRINALAESGVTVLVTTHFMDEANYCDRLVIMAEGEVLAEGTPADMKARFRSPAHPDPSMEDAFIGLIEAHQAGREAAA